MDLITTYVSADDLRRLNWHQQSAFPTDDSIAISETISSTINPFTALNCALNQDITVAPYLALLVAGNFEPRISSFYEYEVKQSSYRQYSSGKRDSDNRSEPPRPACSQCGALSIDVIGGGNETDKDLPPADLCACHERNRRSDSSLYSHYDRPTRRDPCHLLPLSQRFLDIPLRADPESAPYVRVGKPFDRNASFYVPDHHSRDRAAVGRTPAPQLRMTGW
ncbi:hypothetical protein [Neorhizobium sp. T6_25]|uniref:hypothetical protein n=1 Tax=Neorhizobium sp. T6_25 TaxID=2093833 RepID=UPI00155DEFC8|nr:hypothetical protein [Neorhizobium sp. T6_25]